MAAAANCRRSNRAKGPTISAGSKFDSRLELPLAGPVEHRREAAAALFEITARTPRPGSPGACSPSAFATAKLLPDHRGTTIGSFALRREGWHPQIEGQRIVGGQVVVSSEPTLMRLPVDGRKVERDGVTAGECEEGLRFEQATAYPEAHWNERSIPLPIFCQDRSHVSNRPVQHVGSSLEIRWQDDADLRHRERPRELDRRSGRVAPNNRTRCSAQEVRCRESCPTA